jgi:NAD(P)-dependent dehydrogenase (short-subunit alcohol dehydrogenase family)
VSTTVAVVGDAGALSSSSLVGALAARGVRLTAAEPTIADIVVVAHALTAPDAVMATFAELSTLAARSTPPKLLVHLSDGSRVGAGAAGVVKTAGREWGAEYICVTALSVTDVPSRLADELAYGGGEREVRWAAEREVLARVEAPFEGAVRPIPAGPWIVSGGARGVTAACCVALAAAGMRRVVLLGRSALTEEPLVCRKARDEAALKRALLSAVDGKPNLGAIQRQARDILAQREVRATIAALEAEGCEVRYASVDVTDTAAVSALVEDVRASWGPVTGLVHAAGVLADKRLGDKTPEQFASVMTTKLDGARALLAACRSEPLEVLCFFSSVAAHSGNAGQSDYAAANAMLDHWAASERVARGEACRVVSIAWGPWDGGMVTESLAKHFTSRGIGLIPLAGGARAMVDELERGRHAQVIVGCGLDDGDVPRPETLRYDVARAPMLLDHAINGTVVLPMTMALDALLGAGRRALGPQVALRDLQLFQGALLTDGAVELRVSTEVVDAATVRVTLLHLTGRPAYRAVLSRPSASAMPSVPAAPPRASDVPAVCDAPYATALFHGPAFAVIREVLTCTPDGIVARLATAGAMGWSGRWQLDPAALDGALQLLRVWGVAQDGRPSLPTSIALCEVWGAWPSMGDVICHVDATREQGTRLRATVTFTDVAGTCVHARLSGLVMHTQDS